MVESAHYHDLEVVGSSHTTNKKNLLKANHGYQSNRSQNGVSDLNKATKSIAKG